MYLTATQEYGTRGAGRVVQKRKAGRRVLAVESMPLVHSSGGAEGGRRSLVQHALPVVLQAVGWSSRFIQLAGKPLVHLQYEWKCLIGILLSFRSRI